MRSIVLLVLLLVTIGANITFASSTDSATFVSERPTYSWPVTPIDDPCVRFTNVSQHTITLVGDPTDGEAMFYFENPQGGRTQTYTTVPEGTPMAPGDSALFCMDVSSGLTPGHYRAVIHFVDAPPLEFGDILTLDAPFDLVIGAPLGTLP